MLDPVNRYDITVHTLPPVKKDNLEIVAGRHNIVAMDAPQGSLKLRVDGSLGYKRLQCVVKNRDRVVPILRRRGDEKGRE